MSSVLRGNPETIVQGSETGLRGSHQTLGVADGGLSTPQRQQDWLEEKTNVLLKKVLLIKNTLPISNTKD